MSYFCWTWDVELAFSLMYSVSSPVIFLLFETSGKRITFHEWRTQISWLGQRGKGVEAFTRILVVEEEKEEEGDQRRLKRNERNYLVTGIQARQEYSAILGLVWKTRLVRNATQKGPVSPSFFLVWSLSGRIHLKLTLWILPNFYTRKCLYHLPMTDVSPSVGPSIILSNLHSISISGRPTWKVE